MALALGISPKTVEHHRIKLYDRLGLEYGDVAGVTRYALSQGLTKKP